MNTTEPSICGGDAAFLSNYFDHLLHFAWVVDDAKCTLCPPPKKKTRQLWLAVTWPKFNVCSKILSLLERLWNLLQSSVCMCVCLRVCMSIAACPHYCTDPDVTWGNGRGCTLVVHYWANLQSLHGFRCYDNIARTRNVRLWYSRICAEKGR